MNRAAALEPLKPIREACIFKCLNNLLPALRKVFPILKMNGNNCGFSKVSRSVYGLGGGHGQMKIADGRHKRGS
jgi:hypothetical protein